jgi:hypothetical protein
MMWNVFALYIIYLQKCVLSVDIYQNDMFYDWLSETRMFSIDIIIYNLQFL